MLSRLPPGRTLAATLAVVVASVGVACQFKFDRQISKGELLGIAVFQGSPGSPFVPAANAKVAIENSSILVQADAQGHFAIHALPQGTYSLDITWSAAGTGIADSGLRVSGIDLSSSVGGRDLGTLTLGAFGGISGAVNNAGSPVTGAIVALAETATAVTSAGEYRFADLLPGEYALTAVEATGLGERVSPTMNVTVAPRVVTMVGSIDLSQAPLYTVGTAQGQVAVQGGGALPAITMTVSSLPSFSQATDGSGNYDLSLPGGVYTITASAPGYQSASALAMVIAGPATAIPVLTLAPVGEGSGSDAGTPDAGTSAPASHSVGGASFALSSNYQATYATGRAQPTESSSNFLYRPTGVAQAFTAAEGTP